jgi:flagellar biosynthesis protein FlhA
MLDSMPGQQMSIDADLNMGLIDQKEAVHRRAALEKEASFYGAMDGASKFVNGDAVAGVIILLINIIAGWIIGIVQMGMDWQTALQHFSLLTIGDGIATQLPALIVSIATASSSQGLQQTKNSAPRCSGSFPPFRVWLIVGGSESTFVAPGMPKWPISLIAAAVAFWFTLRRRRSEAEAGRSSSETYRIGYCPTCTVCGLQRTAAAWRDKRLIDHRGLRDAHEAGHGIGFPAVKVVDGQHLGPRV